MNKKLLFVMVGLILVITVAVVYVLSQKDTKTESRSTINRDTAEEMSPQPNTSNITKGEYVEYTEEGFVSTRGTKLLFFHAPWCPQCRALDESIKTSDLPADLTIFKVDYDSNQPLRAKYGVTLQTTVVKTDEEGNKLNSYVAYDEPTFQSVKQALIP